MKSKFVVLVVILSVLLLSSGSVVADGDDNGCKDFLSSYVSSGYIRLQDWTDIERLDSSVDHQIYWTDGEMAVAYDICNCGNHSSVLRNYIQGSLWQFESEYSCQISRNIETETLMFYNDGNVAFFQVRDSMGYLTEYYHDGIIVRVAVLKY